MRVSPKLVALLVAFQNPVQNDINNILIGVDFKRITVTSVFNFANRAVLRHLTIHNSALG